MSLLRGLLGARSSTATLRALSTQTQPEPDRLFKELQLEFKGHDPAVLNSYTTFLTSVCNHLDVRMSDVERPKYVRWVQPLLRSKFVHKKYKLHYETRTHIRRLSLYEMTGSTASTVLEYLQRNIPEGVGFKVTYHELKDLPSSIVNVGTS